MKVRTVGKLSGDWENLLSLALAMKSQLSHQHLGVKALHIPLKVKPLTWLVRNLHELLS